MKQGRGGQSPFSFLPGRSMGGGMTPSGSPTPPPSMGQMSPSLLPEPETRVGIVADIGFDFFLCYILSFYANSSIIVCCSRFNLQFKFSTLTGVSLLMRLEGSISLREALTDITGYVNLLSICLLRSLIHCLGV